MKFAFYLVVLLTNQKPDPESGSESWIRISNPESGKNVDPVKTWIWYIDI